MDKPDTKTQSGAGKSIYFLGGLPRAGSTLLANILIQNPRVHVTATSGVIGLLRAMRVQWERQGEFKAMPKEQSEAAKMRVLRGILLSYFADVDKPVVFDKSRGWIGIIPFIEKILGRPAKILVPVRDLRDVLASFERLAERNVMQPTGQEVGAPGDWSTIEGRVGIWMARNGVVGHPYRLLDEALHKGLADRMCLIDYEELTADPATVMQDVYRFIGDPVFEHDFNNVEQKTFEDDDVWKMPGLHVIRKKVEPQPSQWQKVIPPAVAKRLPGKNMWLRALDAQKKRTRLALADDPLDLDLDL